MKKSICIVVLALCLNLVLTSTFLVYIDVYNFGNITLKITTHRNDSEENSKIIMFGQLAEKLSKELNYSKPILLDFHHYYYTDDHIPNYYCIPDFFISYDKGDIEGGGSYTRKYLKKNAIVVRQFARQFDAETTLKLLEYAILNTKNVESSQKKITYKNDYSWRINSIDALTIKEILNTPNSDLLNKVLETRIKRPEKQNSSCYFSYHWENNKYFVVKERYGGMQDSVLIELENIYDFKALENGYAMVFDTDSSFYYVGLYDDFIHREMQLQVSQRQVIENIFESHGEYYRAFNVKNIGKGKIAIYLWGRTSIYLTEEDRLIQDLDKLLKEKPED
jgi:hypothetical protein